MPVNAESYQNGKIYRIWTLLSDKIYIGSTADTLSNRFCNHKSNYKRWLKDNDRQYVSSFKLFEIFGVENCKIDLEHNFACNSKTELNREEGRVQRIHNDKLVNNNIAGRTVKEYHSDNKEHFAEYQKHYYADNKDALLEKQKQYHAENKEHFAEYNKEYRSDNKDAISKQRNEKFSCECGGKYTQQHKTYHLNTAKHQKFIKGNQSSASAC